MRGSIARGIRRAAGISSPRSKVDGVMSMVRLALVTSVRCSP